MPIECSVRERKKSRVRDLRGVVYMKAGRDAVARTDDRGNADRVRGRIRGINP